MYSGPDKTLPSMSVALTEEQEEEFDKQLNTDDEDLVNVDGTKVKLSSKLIKVTIDRTCFNTITLFDIYLSFKLLLKLIVIL
jgi:hypothetical protein